MIGNVLFLIIFDWLLILDILYLYILKLLGYWIMFLFSVSFSCVVFNVFIELEVVVFLLCNVLFVYKSLFLLIIEIIVVKLLLVFFESWMKNKEVSCEGLVMEYRIIKLFFWRVIVGGMVCIWMFWVKFEIIDLKWKYKLYI